MGRLGTTEVRVSFAAGKAFYGLDFQLWGPTGHSIRSLSQSSDWHVGLNRVILTHHSDAQVVAKDTITAEDFDKS